MTIKDLMNKLEQILDNLDIDEALDQRDIPEFDDEWVRADEKLEILKKKNEKLYLDIKADVDEIRKKVFLKVYDICEDEDMAACVSDDFELIMVAEAYGFEDAWLKKMINKYENCIFPCGKLI